MWLAMHACLRANAATTHMLTRFVRQVSSRFSTVFDRFRPFSTVFEGVLGRFRGRLKRREASDPRQLDVGPGPQVPGLLGGAATARGAMISIDFH